MIRTSIAMMGRLRWLGTFLTLAIMLVPLYWAVNRSPPFEVLDVVPTAAKPGQVVRLNINVKRDMSRSCTLTFTRYLYSSGGYRIDLEGEQTMTADMIADMEREHPGKLLLQIFLPLTMSPGAASMGAALAYSCNPLQELFPIRSSMTVPFLVLPVDAPASATAPAPVLAVVPPSTVSIVVQPQTLSQALPQPLPLAASGVRP